MNLFPLIPEGLAEIPAEELPKIDKFTAQLIKLGVICAESVYWPVLKV